MPILGCWTLIVTGSVFGEQVNKATQYEKAALIGLQAMYVKSVTAQFRCAIPGSYPRIAQAHHSLQELEADLEDWHTDQKTFAQRFKERIQDDTTTFVHLDDVKELLGDDDTLANKRKEIVRGQ
jgi:hypothetical protein